MMPQQQPPSDQGAALALDTLIPTNPLAAVACWVGIASVLFCGAGVVLGPIAVYTGRLSLKKGAMIQQSGYGKATSTARSWIGIVAGTVGTITGLGFILFMVFGKR